MRFGLVVNVILRNCTIDVISLEMGVKPMRIPTFVSKLTNKSISMAH